MTYPFSVASNLKARGREIAEKIQNISEITNHINHKTRVYVISRRASTSVFQIVSLFLTLIHFITFQNAVENDGMESEEKKQGKHIYAIRFSLTCHQALIPTKIKKNRTNLEQDDQPHTKRKQNQLTGVLLKRLLFKIQQYFNKIASCRPATLLKRNSFTGFFQGFW